MLLHLSFRNYIHEEHVDPSVSGVTDTSKYTIAATFPLQMTCGSDSDHTSVTDLVPGLMSFVFLFIQFHPKPWNYCCVDCLIGKSLNLFSFKRKCAESLISFFIIWGYCWLNMNINSKYIHTVIWRAEENIYQRFSSLLGVHWHHLWRFCSNLTLNLEAVVWILFWETCRYFVFLGV